MNTFRPACQPLIPCSRRQEKGFLSVLRPVAEKHGNKLAYAAAGTLKAAQEASRPAQPERDRAPIQRLSRTTLLTVSAQTTTEFIS